MTDLVFLQLKAGDGGHGRVSFLREKYILRGGPDGGDGGDGGSIIFRGTTSETTLKWYAGKTKFDAQPGVLGGRRNCFGGKGDNLVLEVPVGTVVWQLTENQAAHQRRLMTENRRLLKRDEVDRPQYQLEKEGPVPFREPDAVFDQEIWDNLKTIENFNAEEQGAIKLAEITEDGQEFVVCQGGFGGHGNDTYKSASERTPLRAQYGTPGEERIIALELRLLADVGLVGLPNAGKSTLLSVLTKARPKIASYPFTTLEPHLGILHDPTSGREVVLADIPGLIEGASVGKGLGYGFLRHVKNSTTLVFVLTLEETQIFDENLTNKEKAALLFKQYEVLKKELIDFDPTMMEKKQLISLSKTDIYEPELLAEVVKFFKKKKLDILSFSAVTGEGMKELQKSVVELSKD